MPSGGVTESLLVIVVIIAGLSFLIGGRRGTSKLFRFLFAPGIGCIGRIIQGVVVLAIVGLVLSYGVSRVFAPDRVVIPGLPIPNQQEKPERKAIVLDVPFNKQELPASGMANSICGYASLSMAAGYALGFKPSMETNVKILHHLGLNPDGHDLSTSRNIIRAGKEMYKLDLASGTWSLDQIKSETASGHPVIAGITAGEIPRSIRGYDFSGPHYLVVIGYDQDSIIVNDPETRYGAGKHYPNECFERAFREQKSKVISGFRR